MRWYPTGSFPVSGGRSRIEVHTTGTHRQLLQGAHERNGSHGQDDRMWFGTVGILHQ